MIVFGLFAAALAIGWTVSILWVTGRALEDLRADLERQIDVVHRVAVGEDLT